MWKTRSKMSTTAENRVLFLFLELKYVKFSTLLTGFSTFLFNIDVENQKISHTRGVPYATKLKERPYIYHLSRPRIGAKFYIGGIPLTVIRSLDRDCTL